MTDTKPPLNDIQRRDISNAALVVRDMLAAGETLRQRSLLLGFLKRFGLAMNNWDGLAAYQDWYNASIFGVQQLPTEYVDYLLYTADKNPSSCVEIGAYSGGGSVFSCAFFQGLNPNFRYVGIDINDELVLDETLTNLLNLEFRIPCSSNDMQGELFDVVFIDGDHSYAWAKRDYLNLGRHAQMICAFHDVNAKEFLECGGGVYKFWRHLRSSIARKTTMVEFAHAVQGIGEEKDAMWMGIGVLDFTRG